MKFYLVSFLIFSSLIFSARAASNMDFSLNFGPSLVQYGEIDDLGDPTINTGMDFNFFLQESHGIGFSFSNEFDFEGTKNFPGIRDASISTFDIHYTYRQIFSPKIQLLFSPGFGWQTLYDETGDYYWGYSYYDDLSTSFIFDYKILGRYIINQWGGDGSETSLFLGGGIMQVFSINDSYKGKDISGTRVSVLFQVGIGF